MNSGQRGEPRDLESRIVELLVPAWHGLHREHVAKVLGPPGRRGSLPHHGYAALFLQQFTGKYLRQLRTLDNDVPGTGGILRRFPAALRKASASRGSSPVHRTSRETSSYSS